VSCSLDLPHAVIKGVQEKNDWVLKILSNDSNRRPYLYLISVLLENHEVYIEIKK